MKFNVSPVTSVLRFSLYACFMLVTALPLIGCDSDMMKNSLKHDRASDLEFQDYRDGMAPRLPELNEAGQAAGSEEIPGLQPYVAAPDTNSKAMPLVSISVNQSVPLRDILFELAQQAEYDLELDPRITGSIIFTARERPFDQVIARIADIAGLRYKFDDDVLRVELDAPYNKVYKIDYLSYIRTNTGSIRNNIAVVSGDGADTGSTYEAKSTSEADFWGELEQNLDQILGGSVSGALKTRRTPKITATDQNPQVAAVAPASTEAGATPNVNVQAPQAVLHVESLPSDEEETTNGSPSGRNAEADPALGGPSTFTINRQAGLINVYAPDKAQKEVEQYMKAVRKAVTSQVLIEAKILEVTLNDAHNEGIDWRFLDLSSGELALNFLSTGSDALLNGFDPSEGLLPVGADPDATNAAGFVAGYAGNDVQALIRAISQFGTVHALASPRLTVLNNQSAVLNVATNEVYFEVDVDVTTEEGVSQVDIDSDIRNVPVGVLVNVQPSINLDNGTVALALRPTITKIANRREDPAVAFIARSTTPPVEVESFIPELNVQEIDSVIQVKSGQPIVMGGLLQDRNTATDSGVPVLSEIPVAGSLFKTHQDNIQKTELVIFLKATILDAPEDSVHNTDKDLYRMFSGDRRPLKL